MELLIKDEACRREEDYTFRLSEKTPEIVRQLVRSCTGEDCFAHVQPMPLPSRPAVIEILRTARNILFPGYFTQVRLERVNLEYYLGQLVSRLFEDLSTQVSRAIRHDCYRYELECRECHDRGREVALAFIKALPDLRDKLATDVRAAFQGDPASRSLDEIIFSYPGLIAISISRMAHLLYHQEVPLIPRMMTEYAHSRTGIDIHPGAHIGESFFIDHGTGVVIGETTKIGDRVRIYQGVTLGALSLPPNAGEKLRNRKRHPTIEDDVIIYAGATILGGETVIGARSIIGGNVWLTESVPPDTKVLLKEPELVYLGNGAKVMGTRSEQA